MEHILLQKAFNFKKKKIIESPEGYLFDNILGAWIDKNNNMLLIQSSSYPAIGSKKEDIETGEDQKGQ
jgi:hypothetical protein